jgi:hypothetical protein
MYGLDYPRILGVILICGKIFFVFPYRFWSPGCLFSGCRRYFLGDKAAGT